MKVRILENPDGSLRVIHPNPKQQEEGESDVDFCERICAKTIANDPSLQGLAYVDIEQAELPVGTRHAWRLKNGKVVIDPAVPAPPHPKQAILDRISSATTIAQLKGVLTEVVKG